MWEPSDLDRHWESQRSPHQGQGVVLYSIVEVIVKFERVSEG